MEEEGREGGVQAQGVNLDCPNAANPFQRCAEYCPVAAPVVKPPPGRVAQNGSAVRSDGELQPAGQGQGQGGVNHDCPNDANSFHRCAEYCPVAAPVQAATGQRRSAPPVDPPLPCWRSFDLLETPQLRQQEHPQNYEQAVTDPADDHEQLRRELVEFEKANEFLFLDGSRRTSSCGGGGPAAASFSRRLRPPPPLVASWWWGGRGA